jgi:hypothetical protein
LALGLVSSAQASVDRPEEMKEALALAEKYYQAALANPKVQANAELTTKIRKAYDAFLETDMYIDRENTGDNDVCSRNLQKQRTSHTEQYRILGFGPKVEFPFYFHTKIYFCDVLLDRPVWFQAQYAVHESIHAAELDQSDEYADLLPNKVPGFECITDGLTFDIIEAAGAAPFRSQYSLRVQSTGPTVYFRHCDSLSPGLSDRAIQGSTIRVFDAVLDPKTPLRSGDLNDPIRYFASIEPNMKDFRQPNSPSLLETAVRSDRADWVKFLLGNTVAEPTLEIIHLIEEKKNAEMLEALEEWKKHQ